MRMLKRIFHFVVDSRITTIAGALCFFLLLNGGSYIFLIASSTSYFIDPSIYINKLLNDGLLKDILLYLFKHSSSLSFNIFLIITSIYSSSSLYYHFIQAGEMITDGRIDYIYSKRIASIIIALVVILAFFVLGVGISTMPFLLHVSPVISYILGIIILILIIYLLNRIILRGYSFYKLRIGIAFSAIYVLVFTIGFIIYMSIFSNFKIVYGYLSIIIVFLFYIYAIMIGILLGIRLNWKKLEG